MKIFLKAILIMQITLIMINAQTIIGYTSFEEPAKGDKYYDTGDAATDHPLQNNEGQASVNYEPGVGAAELGFHSYYTNTLDGVGLTDGDYVGVTDYTPDTNNPYPYGNQGFQISDTDGLMTVTLDTVFISGASSPNVSLYYFVKETGWETADRIRIWVVTESGEINLLSTEVSDIDDLNIEGDWKMLIADLTGHTYAILKFELQSNAADEAIFIDYIQFIDGESNIPPVSDAGIDQNVNINSLVTLNGSGSSDIDGEITTWLWEQLNGQTVSLSSNNEPVVTFTAPSATGELNFKLTVTDNNGVSDMDTVKITVKDVGISTVFISEYIEGSFGNNKYLEIYNGSNTTVDLNSDAYSLARNNDGDGDFNYAVLSDWGSIGIISPGELIVLAASGHTLYLSPDTVLEYNSPVHFNGNDAVALMKNGVIVDIVGEPFNSLDHIRDVALRRTASVTQGNYTYTESEWLNLNIDDVSGLGSHSSNPNLPSITDIIVSPEFIESGNEIEISAVITPVVGAISTVTIKYGADDNLVNSIDCWLENPTTNLWLGYLPSQSGNSKLSYKIVATDDSGNSGVSQVASFLVASQQTTDISYIHENIETLTGSIVTIRGIMTIGAGVLRDDRTSAYIQDTSGKGLNLYHSQLFTDMNRGDEIRAVGYVEKYYSTIEVEDFIYERISTGNALPATQTISITEANSGAWEGTLVKFYGKITEIVAIGAGNKITVSDDNSNTTAVMIWGTTGIDINNYSVDDSYWFRGVESKYDNVAQLLVGYAEDIGDEVAIDEKVVLLSAVFKLNPAYPNPFNPSTNIHWQLDKSCDYELAVFNILGQKVDVISGDFGLAGSYTKTWNANNLPTGVYFIQLSSGNRKLTQKVILLK